MRSCERKYIKQKMAINIFLKQHHRQSNGRIEIDEYSVNPNFVNNSICIKFLKRPFLARNDQKNYERH